MAHKVVTPFDDDANLSDDEAFMVAAAAPSLPGAGPAPAAAAGSFLYIGRGLTANEFTNYVETYNFGEVPPDFVVLHHTAVPYTVNTPKPDGGWIWDANEQGLSEAEIYARRKTHLDEIRDNYRDDPAKLWDRGPHLFIDDRYIWLFTPMYEVGIHAATGNSYYEGGRLHYSIGIEVVGYYENKPWPESTALLVGHAVAVLKRKLGTFELEYRPGPTDTPQAHANSISSHRDYNKRFCPGGAITEAYYLQVLQDGWDNLGGGPIPQPPALSVDSALLGPSSGSRDKAVSYIQARLPANSEYINDVQLIMWYYWVYAPPVGVDPFLAAAQCIFETDSLRSYWAARPRRNPAGLGVREGAGLSFATWDEAVHAHLGQILAFCLRDDEATPAQLEMMQRNPRHGLIGPELRGSVKKVGDLGSRWTPNPAYGTNLVNRALEILL